MDEEHNRARETWYKESLSPNVGASRALLQPGIGIFLQPFGALHSQRLCKEASFISYQPGTVTIKTLAASMPLFDFVYQFVHCCKMALERHWTLNPTLM